MNRAVIALSGITALSIATVIAVSSLDDNPLKRYDNNGFILTATTNIAPGQEPINYSGFDTVRSLLTPEQHFAVSMINEGRGAVDRVRQRRRRNITAADSVGYFVNNVIATNNYYRIVSELDPTSVTTARRIDAANLSPGANTPLAGVVVLVDSGIDVAGLSTDAGSAALQPAPARRDAEVVERLRRAGAIILGHTSTTELVAGVSSQQPGGYSRLGGQTLDAHDPLNRNPGVGAAGAAQALAMDYADLVIAAGPDNTIIGPATQAGLYATTQTGTCPMSGRVPVTGSDDQLGVMGRTPEDLVTAMAVMCSPEWSADDDETPSNSHDSERSSTTARPTTTGNSTPASSTSTAAETTTGESTTETTSSTTPTTTATTSTTPVVSFGRTRTNSDGPSADKPADIINAAVGDTHPLVVISWEHDPSVVKKLAEHHIIVRHPTDEMNALLDRLDKLDIAAAHAAIRTATLADFLASGDHGPRTLQELAHNYAGLAAYGCDLVCEAPPVSVERATAIVNEAKELRARLFTLIHDAGAVAYMDRGPGDHAGLAIGTQRITVPLKPMTQNLAVDAFGPLAFTFTAPEQSTGMLGALAHRVAAARPLLDS